MTLQTDFIARVAPAAVASFALTGIFPSAVIAQAAWESSWGRKAPGNNLFGIKADAGWHGPVVDFATHEVRAGMRDAETDAFRAYPSWQASIEDHARFFHANARYAAALKCTNGPAFCMAIDQAGYATGANYGPSLCAIIAAHDLTQYDKRIV